MYSNPSISEHGEIPPALSGGVRMVSLCWFDNQNLGEREREREGITVCSIMHMQRESNSYRYGEGWPRIHSTMGIICIRFPSSIL